MTDRRRLIATTVLLLTYVSGCAQSPCCPSMWYESGVPRISARQFAETQRSAAPATASSIPTYPEALSAAPSRLTDEQYRGLSPLEAQCRAAEYAPIANLLLSESDAAAATSMCDPDGECSGPLKRELLELRSIEERNRAARNALQLYYRLAEAEAGLDSIGRSLPILDESMENVRQMREQGFTLPMDPSQLEQQRLELLNQREQVQLAILQLNEQLAQALGVVNPHEVRFWPEVDWSVGVASLNEGAMIAIGMSQRADLAMLRVARAGLNSATVSAARQVLSLTNAALGQSSPAAMMLSHKLRCACASCEQDVRQEQLDALVDYQEENAASEIRQAAYVVETRMRQVAIAADRLKSARVRLEDVRALRRVDRATAFELSAAELTVIEGETDLLRAIIALRLAEVDLAAAQGMLAVDCGYSVGAY